MKYILKNRPKMRPEKLGGRRLTLPGLYVKPYEALQQYSDRSVEQKAADYYKDEGMPIPDFEMMDKIERLQALSEWRGKAIEVKAMLDKRNSEAEKAAIQADIDKQIQLKIHEFKQQHAASTGTGGHSG